MDKLEDFIRQHAAEFRSVTPPDGHFARFCDRLPASPAPRRGYRWRKAAAVAACAICMAGLIRIIAPLFHNPATPHLTEATEAGMHEGGNTMSATLADYRSKIERVMARIETLSADCPGNVADEMLAESRQILTASTKFEKQYLPDLPPTDTGRYAVMSHYTTTLESLNHILRILETITDI